MEIITTTLEFSKLKAMAFATFGDMVKVVVDVERQILALDAELHSDLESMLLENGSKQKDLWGINLYPDMREEDFVEFDSLINIRPSQGNRSRGIVDKALRAKIVEIVSRKIKR